MSSHFREYRTKDYLTLGKLKRDKIRTVLWVIFPQGIVKKHGSGILYSGYLSARTLKKAWKLLLKYNGADIERLYETKHYGRRSISLISRIDDQKLNQDELWDMYRKFKEVNLDEKLMG